MARRTPRPRPRKKGTSRRDFLKYSATAGAVLGASQLFPLGCGGGGGSHGPSPQKELRTYYFDLSGADQSQDFYLVAGVEQHKLQQMSLDQLSRAQRKNPFVRALPPTVLTHYGKDIPMPANGVQLCFVRGLPAGQTEGSWTMPLTFFHLPRSSVQKARARRIESTAGGPASAVEAKLRLYGVDPLSSQGLDAASDATYEDDVKTAQDQAVANVASHPEMLSGDPVSAAYIQKNIIGPQPTTFELAVSIEQQGTPTESGGWATLQPIINPNTGQPYLNSQGQTQYLQVWSSDTQTYTGAAIQPSLQAVKNDTTLGANITDLAPDDLNTALQGKVWTIRDGVPTLQAGSQSAPGDSFSCTFSNLSPSPGFKASVVSFDSTSGNVTFEIQNSFVRYLGVYVRYLDANGNPIPYDSLPSATQQLLPSWGRQFSSDMDQMVAMATPEFTLLGIPLKSEKLQVPINIPETASKVLVLAGGLGYGTKSYPDTLSPGIAMTAAVCIGVPALFIACNAASAYNGFVTAAGTVAVDTFIVEALAILGEGLTENLAFDNSRAWWECAEELSEGLLGTTAPFIVGLILTAIGQGSAALNSIPILGNILAAISSVGLVADLDETSVECVSSPWTFAYELTLSHNIAVTINHDQNDYEFPAVANYYVVTALFDNGTPVTSGQIQMPGTTVSNPLQCTFTGVPYGGNVNISVGFYSNQDDWLAGQGSTGVLANTVDSVTITITENKVPLTINTQYSHREKIVLDANGNHIWDATASPPSATQGSLSCENAAGDLCGLLGITVSEQFAAIGYSWKSCSSGISSCDSGSSGQLNQFGNLSILQNPQAGLLAPSCGFSAPIRVVYDLMSSQNNNWWLDSTGGNQLVRQIRLQQGAPPSIDGPGSNVAWGTFQNPCDTLVLHPSRKLVSISAALNKIEVLDLPQASSSDADAPLALPHSGTGTREGLVNGPVAAAVTPQGAILVLESANQRMQAFDVGINPTPYFKAGAYTVPLLAETGVTYLDMAVEYTGYIYVLSYVGTYQYRLDIYTPDGDFLTRTTGVNAACCTVDFWRNVYTLNYELLKLSNGQVPSITEPSVSQWIPSPP